MQNEGCATPNDQDPKSSSFIVENRCITFNMRKQMAKKGMTPIEFLNHIQQQEKNKRFSESFETHILADGSPGLNKSMLGKQEILNNSHPHRHASQKPV